MQPIFALKTYLVSSTRPGLWITSPSKDLYDRIIYDLKELKVTHVSTRFQIMVQKSEIMKNPRESSDGSSFADDDRELVALGYQPSFKREFSNLATVRPQLFPVSVLFVW
jgi:hypothetical protein